MISFFRFFVTRHTFALLLTTFIIILGLITFPNINRNTFPTVDLDEVIITTTYPGASPEDIELKISNPIETKIKSIDGIKEYSSISMENLSLVRILLSPDLPDPDKVKQDIKEAIDRIMTFPSDLEDDPNIIEINTASFPVLEVGLTSETLQYSELREIAKDFKDQIESIVGVSELESYGFLANEVQILPFPEKLDDYQISVMQIISTIANRNIRASMGNLKLENKEATIINDSQLLNTNDIRNAIVRSNFNGQSVRISDLALVKDGFEDEQVISKLFGYKGISYNITKTETADILTVTNKIQDVIDSFKASYPEVKLVTANDFSKYLRNRLTVMTSNGVIGLVLVIAVLTFFLNIRMAFWVSLGIPVSIMGVFFLMPMFNMTINIISLLALIIVIGIIVDDGIIIAENIAKYQEKGHSMNESSILGITGVFKPVVTTIFTTIVAFSPMFFMSGIMGKFIFQIPLVITLALFISFIEVVIALPAHLASSTKSLLINNGQKIPKRHRFIQVLKKGYGKILNVCLRYKYSLVSGFIIIFISSLYYTKHYMNFVLFPESSAVQFLIRVESEPGTTVETMSKAIEPIEKAIMELPNNELQAFTTRVGMTGDSYFFIQQENLGIILVDLVPFTGRTRSAREIMQEIKESTENTPGFKKITYQVESGGPPVGKALNVEIIVNDDIRRKQVSNAMFNFVENIPGVVSVERNDRAQKDQIHINFDYDNISRLGLNIRDIHTTIRTAFSGAIASTIRKGDEDINFVIKFSKFDSNQLRNLEDLRIPNSLGRLISLKEVATLELKEGVPNYFHYQGDRSTSIYGDIDKNIITSLEITNLIKDTFNSTAYPDVIFQFGGESEETNESIQGLIRSFGAALIGIFFLLVLLFNSFWQPFLVLLTVPFGLIGVIFAFALHGQDLGFISMVGAVGLTGVVVNDSLVLLNHINTLKNESDQPIMDIVHQGAVDRFRPILITSFSTVAGLLPLAYGLGGSDPFIAPMALAIGYGLLFSTPLTLFLLPALQLIYEDAHRFFSRSKH